MSDRRVWIVVRVTFRAVKMLLGLFKLLLLVTVFLTMVLLNVLSLSGIVALVRLLLIACLFALMFLM